MAAVWAFLKAAWMVVWLVCLLVVVMADHLVVWKAVLSVASKAVWWVAERVVWKVVRMVYHWAAKTAGYLADYSDVLLVARWVVLMVE